MFLYCQTKNNMRISILCLGLLTILTGPWWIPLLCMILLCLRWQAIEALAIGLMMDFIWQGGSMFATTSWHGIPLFTIMGIFFLWSLEPWRRHLLIS
jgi:hypothetical protein